MLQDINLTIYFSIIKHLATFWVFATQLCGDHEFHQFKRGGQIIRRGGQEGGATFHGGGRQLMPFVPQSPPPKSETLPTPLKKNVQ